MVVPFSEYDLSEEPVASDRRPLTPELIPDFSEDDDSESSISSGPPTPRPYSVSSLDSFEDAISLVDPSLPNLTDNHTSSVSRSAPKEPLESVLRHCEVKEVCDRPIHRTNIVRNAKPPASLLPDRFIPKRGFMDRLSTSFHVGHDSKELSPEEKFLRHRSERDDPFIAAQPRRQSNTSQVSLVHRRTTSRTPHLINDAIAVPPDGSQHSEISRRDSSGGIWPVVGISAALGRRLNMPFGAGPLPAGRAAAPIYSANFLPRVISAEEQMKYENETHEARIALALDIDRSKRLLNNSRRWPLLESMPYPNSQNYERFSPLIWKDNAWRRAGQDRWTTATAIEGKKSKVVPTRPFRILDAPYLRDDFYCSTLAYSPVAGILAVGLAQRVYLWSDVYGVQYPPLHDHHTSNYVSSLSFSSENGGKSILAIGRQSGMLTLWSTFDNEERFEVSHPQSITCVAFKQSKTRRLSERFYDVEVDTEDLAIGDDLGHIWYYSVEWPDDEVRGESDWKGSMTLIAKIRAHGQQICGIAWSPDGTYLASGGNDNACLIFELSNIIPPDEFTASPGFGIPVQSVLDSPSEHSDRARGRPRQRYLVTPTLRNGDRSVRPTVSTSLVKHIGIIITGRNRTVEIPEDCQKHRLHHMAAVKALAFAPWQPSLLATGGGSNDRAIRFFHTPSGACLATINVYAQVTSLIWSKTRREIVATFGFAQPEHPFRIAVFAWPSCEQISAIPWGPYGSSWSGGLGTDPMRDCGRALCAVSYPCRPSVYVFDQPTSKDDSSIPAAASNSGQRMASSSSFGQVSVQPRAKEGGMWCSRTVEEGCIIVASSDQSVKFHEVWSNSRRSTTSTLGPYGGSEILEGLEGLEKTGDEIIR